MINVLLYRLSILCYKLLILLASAFNAKAASWLKGRNKLNYNTFFNSLNTQPLIWLHASSLGEYEQGRPILDALFAKHPTYQFVVSFFSPSGYEVINLNKNYFSCVYLPLDTPKNAKKFIERLNPTLVIWVKYDYWYFMLKALYKNNIALYLVSAYILQSQPFFKWYGGLQLKCLQFFKHIFVQDANSKNLLLALNKKLPVTVAGDTRYARALHIANEVYKNDVVKQFKANEKLIICGSTWTNDIDVLKASKAIENFKLIIAPHNINTTNINYIITAFPNCVLYSNCNVNELQSKRVLVIDCIGMLAKMYRYATIVFVGGGFTKSGIHNIVEPAAYNIPVLFGQNYKKYLEAEIMLKENAALSFTNVDELNIYIDKLLNDGVFYDTICDNVKQVFSENCTAVDIILKEIG